MESSGRMERGGSREKFGAMFAESREIETTAGGGLYGCMVRKGRCACPSFEIFSMESFLLLVVVWGLSVYEVNTICGMCISVAADDKNENRWLYGVYGA